MGSCSACASNCRRGSGSVSSEAESHHRVLSSTGAQEGWNTVSMLAVACVQAHHSDDIMLSDAILRSVKDGWGCHQVLASAVFIKNEGVVGDVSGVWSPIIKRSQGCTMFS